MLLRGWLTLELKVTKSREAVWLQITNDQTYELIGKFNLISSSEDYKETQNTRRRHCCWPVKSVDMTILFIFAFVAACSANPISKTLNLIVVMIDMSGSL